MNIDLGNGYFYTQFTAGKANVVIALNREVVIEVPSRLSVSFGKKVKELKPKVSKKQGVVRFPTGSYFLAVMPNKNRSGIVIRRLDIIAKDEAGNKITQLINLISTEVNAWQKANGPELNKIREKGKTAYKANVTVLFTTVAVLSRFVFNGQLAQYLMNLDKEEDEQEQN